MLAALTGNQVGGLILLLGFVAAALVLGAMQALAVIDARRAGQSRRRLDERDEAER